MKYKFYLRLKVGDNEWLNVGHEHNISWDNRDLIKASSGWLIVNRENLGMCSDIIPKLHKGIMELTNSQDAYNHFELNHGLGTIKNVLNFYESLLKDCQQHPYAELWSGISE